MKSSTKFVLGFAFVAIPLAAFAAYTGRTQAVTSQGVVLGYRQSSTLPGVAYRTDVAFVDTAGDVTVSPGLGDLPRIDCGGFTQVSASVLAPITTGSYTLRCVRLRMSAAAGTLVATDFTDAACSVPSSPQYTESDGYLTNAVAFDTLGAPKVVILVATMNHPTQTDLDMASIFAETN